MYWLSEVFRQYMIAVGMSVFLSMLFSYCGIIVFEVFIHKLTGNQVLNEQIPLIVMGGMVFFNDFNHNFNTFKFGTKHDKTRAFISIGSFSQFHYYFLFFGIWVIQFSQYNQLYGSIGTLLIMMFYIWINCMILLRF
jgi:membrane protein